MLKFFEGETIIYEFELNNMALNYCCYLETDDVTGD